MIPDFEHADNSKIDKKKIMEKYFIRNFFHYLFPWKGRSIPKIRLISSRPELSFLLPFRP